MGWLKQQNYLKGMVSGMVFDIISYDLHVVFQISPPRCYSCDFFMRGRKRHVISKK